MACTLVPDEICDKVLAVIKASNGKPCPKNREIANAIGVRNADIVSAALMLLVDEGILERFGTTRRRQFRVSETGEITTKPVIVSKGVRENKIRVDEGVTSKPIIYHDVKLADTRGGAWGANWPVRPTARRTDFVSEDKFSKGGH